MNVSAESLKRIDKHWAVQAIGAEKLRKVEKLTNQWLVDKAVGRQFHFNFAFTRSDRELLDRVSMAYEIAAIEGLSDFINTASSNHEIRAQCASGAYRAFEIRRLFELPATDELKIFHILHLSALACCGGRWTDLRRWYKEEEHIPQFPSAINASWDDRLLKHLFECWVRLFRKDRWNDINRVRKIIIKLRKDQEQYESEVLSSSSNAGNQAMALRLISLYHWAKATEIQAGYMLEGEPAGAASLLNKHFEAAVEAAAACLDGRLEILLRWLHVAARQMMTDSKPVSK